MNDLIRPALYQAHHEILPVIQNPKAQPAVVDIVGPVCETGDFFARDRELPEVKEGTWWRFWTPVLMECHSAPITIPGPGPRKFWSRTSEPGSSAAGKLYAI